MFSWSAECVRDLREQVGWLRQQLAYERQRADQAVAELARLRTAALPGGPADLSPRPAIAPTQPDIGQEIRELFSHSEVAEVGR